MEGLEDGRELKFEKKKRETEKEKNGTRRDERRGGVEGRTLRERNRAARQEGRRNRRVEAWKKVKRNGRNGETGRMRER